MAITRDDVVEARARALCAAMPGTGDVDQHFEPGGVRGMWMSLAEATMQADDLFIADYENQISELMAGMDQVEARVGELSEALEKCLDHEKSRAKLSGLSDCTCMNYSRDSEREYEAGRCPHQLARTALAGDGKDGG